MKEWYDKSLSQKSVNIITKMLRNIITKKLRKWLIIITEHIFLKNNVIV